MVKPHKLWRGYGVDLRDELLIDFRQYYRIDPEDLKKVLDYVYQKGYAQAQGYTDVGPMSHWRDEGW